MTRQRWRSLTARLRSARPTLHPRGHDAVLRQSGPPQAVRRCRGVRSCSDGESRPCSCSSRLLISKSGPGPVLFVQERLGRDGRPFKFYKFRSMMHNSDDAIHRQFAAMFINGDEGGCAATNAGEKVFKLKRDPRITSIGAFLRRTSLDETPAVAEHSARRHVAGGTPPADRLRDRELSALAHGDD